LGGGFSDRGRLLVVGEVRKRMKNRRLFISFSGGETSALMTFLVLTRWRDQWDEIVIVFANTGFENEATLAFVRQCEALFGVRVVWVEAVVDPQKRRGTTHRVVTFETASRCAEPFRTMIEKFGIPNQKFPHCTRELKQRPLYSYIKSLGWKKGTYDIAIGIRADEPHRLSKTAAENHIIYPLAHLLPLGKPDVNLFWSKQPFRLYLLGYEGNCKTCWKKSLRKLLTIMQDDPEKFDFFEEMERLFPHSGSEFEKTFAPGYHRVFFRGNASVADLRRLCAEGGFERAENDVTALPSGERVSFDAEPGDGCTENCEVNFEELL
jgi:hypothetical protein